jgi:hypothetical protein
VTSAESRRRRAPTAAAGGPDGDLRRSRGGAPETPSTYDAGSGAAEAWRAVPSLHGDLDDDEWVGFVHLCGRPGTGGVVT